MTMKKITIFFKRTGVLILGISFLITIKLNCQSPGYVIPVISPSPVASNFTIYGDYPVSLNTGIPDIQIPLYNLQFGDIEIPIVLKYHIGSAKPNQYSLETSNIGYGWILDAGGIVTRTVFGKQDESDGLLSTKYRDEYDQDDFDDYNTLRDISVGQIDSEYDIFDYSYNRGSGKFLIYKSGSIYKVSSFPYVPWKWNFSFSGSDTSKLISSVKIRDDKGFDYLFSDVESNGFANSGWYLSQINSPNNRSANFSYAERDVYLPASTYYNYRYDVTDYHMGYNIFGEICDPQLPNLPINSQEHYTPASHYYTKSIKEISCESGKVLFTLNADSSLIEYFIVYDNDDNPLKKVTFSRSLFPGQTVYHRLDSISIEDSNDNSVQKYKFEYNPNSVLNSSAVDYWGWYNGVTNTLHVPYTELDYLYSNSYWGLDPPPQTETVGDLNRCVDETKILAQTLNKIYYPTGGYTEFEFDPNQFDGDSPCNDNSLGFGLRIKSITNVVNESVASKKTYVYQAGFVPRNRFESYNYVNVSYAIDGALIFEYDCGPKTYATFRRTRSYNEDLTANILDNKIRYSEVDEFFGTISSNVGKNSYYFTNNNDHIYSYHSEDMVTEDGILLISIYRNWANGLLDKLETYKKEAGSSYTKVHEINYDYELFNDTTFHSLRVFELTNYPSEITFGPTTYYGDEVPPAIRNNTTGIPTPSVFGVYNYYILTGGYVPTKTTETFYLPEQVTSTLSNNYENGFKKYLTRTIQDSGMVNMVTRNFTYPYDYADPIYETMVDSNRIDYVIEQIENKNGSIQKSKTTYKDWDDGIIEPDSVLTSNDSSSYENRFNYLKYDEKGNIVSASKAYDIATTYIWGYNKTYPVAEVKNATYSEVNSVTPNISLLEFGNTTEQQRIRSALPDALITFYTYKPLVGLTSQTDHNGITTYYEYDTFNRLYQILNQNNKVVKEFKYNYAIH